MSYLLEALKRLEQKRQREGTSDLLLVQGTVTREGRRRAVWPYVLSAALLANAAVAFWWIAPWRADRSVSPPPPVTGEVARPAPPAPPQAALKDGEEKPSGHPKTDTDTMRASSAKAVPQPAVRDEGKRTGSDVPPAGSSTMPRPEQTVRPPQTSATPRPEQAVRPPQTSPRTQAPVEKKPTLDRKVVDVQDLPAAVKAGVPPIKLSVHSYEADRSARLVRINDRTLTEGQFFTPEIKVEEITPDGVILKYQGYFFRIILDYLR